MALFVSTLWAMPREVLRITILVTCYQHAQLFDATKTVHLKTLVNKNTPKLNAVLNICLEVIWLLVHHHGNRHAEQYQAGKDFQKSRRIPNKIVPFKDTGVQSVEECFVVV